MPDPLFYSTETDGGVEIVVEIPNPDEPQERLASDNDIESENEKPEDRFFIDWCGWLCGGTCQVNKSIKNLASI